MEGMISNIQRYSIHDGPGIRTTIFLKGCPLSCWWCHNPETISLDKQLMVFQERCMSCDSCGTPCHHNAKEYVGELVQVKELIKEIKKDEPFYEQSLGGVTFSGGEPFSQPDFLYQLLSCCKEEYIHTAVDTSGHTPWQNIERMLEHIELFLFDLKIMDRNLHKKYTGVTNDLILDNLKKLSSYDKQIHISIPIIWGINHYDQNILDTIAFLSNLNITHIRLLPYHKIGMEKYRRLNMSYKLTGNEKPTEEMMSQICNRFKDQGFNVRIGG